jgi:hypothetical protein
MGKFDLAFKRFRLRYRMKSFSSHKIALFGAILSHKAFRYLLSAPSIRQGKAGGSEAMIEHLYQDARP